MKSRFKGAPDNTALAELLCREAEQAGYPLQRAFRRAGRAAFLWHEEAAALVEQDKPLTELHGVGPFIEKQLRLWLTRPPALNGTPELRRHFLTWTKAQQILERHPDFKTGLRGDLQMHTEWSDGSGTIRSMAEAAITRGYEYIAITDHAKRLKIAGGINEAEVEQQGREIAAFNLESKRKPFRILRSIELNLLKIARQTGVHISLGTDSHHPWQLEFMDFGLAAAALAGIPRDRILNFMSRQELLDWVRAIKAEK